MHEATESAALAVWQALACEIQSTSPKLQISNLQISNPLKISPSTPAHSARPTHLAQGADFVIFKKQ